MPFEMAWARINSSLDERIKSKNNFEVVNRASENIFFNSQIVNVENILDIKTKDSYFVDEYNDNQLNDESFNLLKIQSDIQYDLNNQIFVAEGDAKVRINSGVLTADRIEYNRELKSLKAFGNVTFERGNQLLMADQFTYEFLNKSGELLNAYGILNLKYLGHDLNFSSSLKRISEQSIDNDKVDKVELVDGYNLELSNFNYDINNIYNGKKVGESISSWRMKSPKIRIDENGWSSPLIIFTNDPFNPTQFSIEGRGVIAKSEGNIITLETDSSRMVFENKIRIPIMKKRFSNKKEEKNRWEIGFNKKDKDGLYFSRRINSIYLSPKNKLELRPEFYLQREIESKSNSYSDLLGLSSKLEGIISEWEFEMVNDFSSFNFGEIDENLRSSMNLKKNINLSNYRDLELNVFSAYRKRAWNGSLGETEINSAFGSFLEKKDYLRYGPILSDYKIAIGIANYNSEELKTKDLTSRIKTSLFLSLNSEYPLWKEENIVRNTNERNKYIPVYLDPKISFKTKIDASYSYYGNDDSQAFLKISAGPVMQIGKLEESFMDYTYLSVLPSIKIKSGISPFKFDNAVDLKNINIVFKQQVFGPLILSSKFGLNINSDSSNYGDLYNHQIGLLFSRRAYEFGLAYYPAKAGAGFHFRLNGFDFDRSTSAKF